MKLAARERYPTHTEPDGDLARSVCSRAGPGGCRCLARPTNGENEHMRMTFEFRQETDEKRRAIVTARMRISQAPGEGKRVHNGTNPSMDASWCRIAHADFLLSSSGRKHSCDMVEHCFSTIDWMRGAWNGRTSWKAS